jgi:hypothetical protein
MSTAGTAHQHAEDQSPPVSDAEESPPKLPRRPWQTPKVIVADARLAMHGNCGGIGGIFSSS